jgi:RNA polymerase sigma-70 factor (ECF subfamily)
MKLFKRDLSKMSDESLMGCVQDGKVEALDNLYDRYSNRLLHYFHRMLNRDDERAQDFLHDLFIKIVERPTAFDTKQSFSTWIFIVAHNMCKNEYRRLEVRTRETTVEQIRMDSHSGSADIDMALDAKAFKQAVLDALDELEPSHRSTFLLRYQEDLTIREISNVLECAEGTTKSRLHYVTKRLSEQLKEMNPFATETT